MKKFVFSAVLAFLCAEGFSVGLAGVGAHGVFGGTLPLNVTGNAASKTSGDFAFDAGAYGYFGGSLFRSRHVFYVAQIEANYHSFSVKNTFPDGVEDEQSFSFFSVPLLLKLGFGGEKAAFWLYAGEAISFAGKGKQKILDSGLSLTNETDIKGVNFDAVFGAELRFLLGGHFDLCLGARFDAPSDLKMTRLNGTTTEWTLATVSGEIAIGYRFASPKSQRADSGGNSGRNIATNCRF